MAGNASWRSWANRLHDLVLARQWIHYVPVLTAEEWAAASGMRLIHGEDFDMLWYRHNLRVFERPRG
jgi:hypothetical protein